ncbi:MAG: pantetheine-phosphate adenylyltransferase [Saprospiraceae bacterium]|nr:pantetheine-phosphate adenylyltransferase [Saprospiraceae bacterium]
MHTKRIAVFPGSFDPITTGHVDLVRRALTIFDEIIIAIGVNSQKQTLFPVEERKRWIQKVFEGDSRIRVDVFEGLTVHYCKKVDAHFLLRGLRNASDFDYEKTISQLNHIVGEDVETLFLISKPEFSHISSTIVREIIKGGGNAKPFLPDGVRF